MSRILLFAAVFCAFIALVISLGASLFGWTWEPWVTGAILAYLLSLVVPA